MHFKKSYCRKTAKEMVNTGLKAQSHQFLTITFLGAFCHLGKLTFLKSAQNYNFFDTHEDLFLRKIFGPLLSNF